MGPISTHKAFTCQGPRPLRSVLKSTYIDATQQLQELDLGAYHSEIHGGVFFKKHPSEVEDVLIQNRDLADADQYIERYNLLVPTAIGANVRNKLVSMGLMSMQQFR